jgi:hypothetical protein
LQRSSAPGFAFGAPVAGREGGCLAPGLIRTAPFVARGGPELKTAGFRKIQLWVYGTSNQLMP